MASREEGTVRHRLKIFIRLGVMGILFAACGTTQEARKEDRALEDFQAALAQRQVERRRETLEQCRQRGVILPEDYLQKGGRMLEGYVADRPPCGITAVERTRRAEADFRSIWGRLMRRPVPVGYEWLLMVKRRIAELIDGGVITTDQARAILLEAQFILADRDRRDEISPMSGQVEQGGAKVLGELNSALNSSIAEQGITCSRTGERRPCF